MSSAGPPLQMSESVETLKMVLEDLILLMRITSWKGKEKQDIPEPMSVTGNSQIEKDY